MYQKISKKKLTSFRLKNNTISKNIGFGDGFKLDGNIDGTQTMMSNSLGSTILLRAYGLHWQPEEAPREQRSSQSPSSIISSLSLLDGYGSLVWSTRLVLRKNEENYCRTNILMQIYILHTYNLKNYSTFTCTLDKLKLWFLENGPFVFATINISPLLRLL